MVFSIYGEFNKAKVFATQIDNECIAQIIELCNQKWLKNCQIAIMPDCHNGKGCTIGTTIKLKDKVCPSLVGVDLGCGMLSINIPKELNVDLEILKKTDEFINENIPSGFNVNKESLVKPYEDELSKLYCYEHLKGIDYLRKSIGSLGSGNHFIEINEDSKGRHYLVIHSGSRNLGKQIAEYYQDIAFEHCNQQKAKHKKEREKIIQSLKEKGKQNEIQKTLEEFEKNYISEIKISKELSYLEGKDAEHYLHDAKIAVRFASLNRKYIAKRILEYIVFANGYQSEQLNVWLDEYQQHQFEFGFDDEKIDVRSLGFETIHNYIDGDNVLRKGAISAHKGEKVLIPINMRDGSIIGIGKGNEEYNCSGPHGAGRLMSRSQAKETVKFKEFKESMKDIYSTSVCDSTLDESPMAYKTIKDITKNIEDSIEVLEIIKPIYNFKAH